MMKGTVIKSTGSWYSVRFEDGSTGECRIRGKLRMKGIRLTNPVAVGDKVTVERTDGGLVIAEIDERKNYIIRRSVNLSKEAHIIAANVDLAVMVATIRHPEVSTAFIDRFLAVSEAYSVPALLVFNKTDLYGPDDMEKLDNITAIYESIGYPCLKLSAVSGNVDSLAAAISCKTVVFSGQSGVGKSSLINTLAPGLSLKTAEISSAHDSGRHTTTFAEMFRLWDETYIIDTPGIRGLGMVDMRKEECCHYFPEIFRVSAGCRFGNCSHTHEPDCAVQRAVETGEIAVSRYASYLGMMEDDDSGRYRL